MNKNNNKKNNRNNRNNNQRRVRPSDRALELLGYYQETLCMGFNDETWTQATRILNDMSQHIDLDTHHELASLMSTAYVDASIQNVILGCEKVALRLQQSQTKTNR
jgi:hypothetical protein